MGWNQFFGFNKKERIGVIALTVFLILIVAGYLFLPRFFSSFEQQNTAHLKDEVEKFITAREKQEIQDQAQEETNSNHDKQKVQTSIYETKQLSPFKFNPNNLPEEKWKAIGFSGKQISIIKNYEAHGGTFRKKEDLKRIYGIGEEEYAQLESYINIPDTKKAYKAKAAVAEESKEKEEAPKAKPLTLDLNTADSTDLRKIHGIGPVFSARIVKFRNLLGGFYSPEQLVEVYGIDSSKYEQLKEHFYTDASAITTINVNTATFKQMAAHPYLDQYLVKAIIQYRQDNGPLQNLAELKNISLVYDDLYKRINPYFTLR